MKARILLLATLLAGGALPCAAQAEGKLAQLYAPRPPAGSAFVRVLQPADNAIDVQVGQNPSQQLGAGKLASGYNVVKGGEPFTVRMAGKAVGTLTVAADTYQSLVLHQGTLLVLDDGAASEDALKAELRFYNLAGNCPAGQLQVQGGPALFTEVAARSSKARAINPVSASLTAGCGATQAKALALPPLQPGDHYALFLTGDASQPVLRGELGSTAPFTR
ncbi:cell division protein FtsQ [Pseudomonas putida]|uniref:Alginate biosynthesis protein AlgF n=1 Tax=Pseudomonas putida TaxID=303 RepID=A0AA37VST9_PSEPU|nr:alginate O-acetyltransferase AlgF [Pseudomonas putida]GLO12847.1 cell division protein FtsQ [Pseudomonas putida]GLO35957.1 cell division protein FtsQ [Pseudomonas putida]HDS0962679.1 alginate O-acetyltransferase AlgF [Pseudomonas putida]HDS0989527.1 alginate O-acetyltransferase AlgF [Pseudomonas putida]